MSTRKSPLYTALAVVFGIIVLAGGAAKLYRGFSNLTSSGLDPKVGELLRESDAAIAEVNRETNAVVPAFQELLNDFDKMELAAFRAEKRETCTKLSEQFAAVGERLQLASKTIIEATQLGTDADTTAFLMARSKSYDLLIKVSKQNIDIIRATLDESVVDMDAIVGKVLSIAANRDADQKAADEATAAANAMIKRS